MPQNGPFDFRFSLYASPSDLTWLWQEEHSAVSVVAGAFVVVLGEDVALGDDLWTDTVYLGVEVRESAATPVSYVALVGRQQILAVPRAARADYSPSFHVSGNIRVDGVATVGGSLRGNPTLVIAGATHVQGETTMDGSLAVAKDLAVGGTRVWTTLDGRTMKDWRLAYYDDFEDGTWPARFSLPVAPAPRRPAEVTA